MSRKDGAVPSPAAPDLDRSLSGVDLNLLRALHALLTERSVTQAARQLGVSQPTASASLARLRRHFNDELLVRRGRGFELTPLGRRLLPSAGDAVAAAQRLFSATPAFDPATSDRTFRLILSDYAALVLGSELTTRLSLDAPHVGFELRNISPPAIRSPVATLRRVDGLVFPIGSLLEGESTPLYEDDWVVVACSGNSAIGDELTEHHLATLPWAVAYHGPNAFLPALHELRARGAVVKTPLRTESFLQLPFLVAGTDHIAFVQRRLAARLAGPAGLRVFESPVAVPRLRQALWWDSSFDADPGHRWLRTVLADLVPFASDGTP